MFALCNKDFGGLEHIISKDKINWKERGEEVVDYFKFLPLNSPGVNDRNNEVQSCYNCYPGRVW
jgi:hypothetical protein